MPGSAKSFAPTSGLPTMLGPVVLVGGSAGVIGLVGFELTGPTVPPELVAVTNETNVWLMSAEASVYVVEVAPLIGVQPLPFWSQRSHW